jgi:hypothetical protein
MSAQDLDLLTQAIRDAFSETDDDSKLDSYFADQTSGAQKFNNTLDQAKAYGSQAADRLFQSSNAKRSFDNVLDQSDSFGVPGQAEATQMAGQMLAQKAEDEAAEEMRKAQERAARSQAKASRNSAILSGVITVGAALI